MYGERGLVEEVGSGTMDRLEQGFEAWLLDSGQQERDEHVQSIFDLATREHGRLPRAQIRDRLESRADAAALFARIEVGSKYSRGEERERRRV